MNQDPPLSHWRMLLWPIHRHELKTFLPMLVIFFLLSFNYNLLRLTKDALIITASAAGAEVLPFIKFWVMLPCAILMTRIFTYSSSRLSREYTFYTMTSLFLGYFFIFGTVLYPNRQLLEPTQLCDWLSHNLPRGYSGMIVMIRYWIYTSFYVMAELWGSAIMSVSFWGFANEVTRVDQAKRFYGFLGIGANLSGIAAGEINLLITSKLPTYVVNMVLMTILLLGLGALLLFYSLNRQLGPQHLYHEPKTSSEEKKQLSWHQELRYLIHSPYILSIATIVLAFGFVINSTEVLWKAQIYKLYPDPVAYSNYSSNISIWTGYLSTLGALLFTSNLIRWTGWTFSAMITPTILLLTSIGFFAFLLFSQLGESTVAYGWSTTALAVFIGSIQNVLSRTAKYTVFDTTKELAFVPLERHTRLKGKAVIDGIISRLGKSSASALYAFLLLQLGTLENCTPIIGAALLVSIILWMRAVLQIGKDFNRLAVTPK